MKSAAITALKWVITLTAPLWILPVGLVMAFVMLFMGIHDSLWSSGRGGHRRWR
jgi:hypothetical protein